tara:strand:+ start:217 stop:744 length:528 start_codon:yes stop_codon:yes gene_type:complete
MERFMSEDKLDEGYEAGYRDGERSERKLWVAAAKQFVEHEKFKKELNINVHNQAITYIGIWLGIYSKERWADSDGAGFTVERMAQEIVNNWSKIMGQLNTELQRQFAYQKQTLEIELNKQADDKNKAIKIVTSKAEKQLLKIIGAREPYGKDTVKKHIRRSKPKHLVAGRPRKKT